MIKGKIQPIGLSWQEKIRLDTAWCVEEDRVFHSQRTTKDKQIDRYGNLL